MRHSPGPWRASPDGNIYDALDRLVAEDVRTDVDARLISAAPRLRAALHGLCTPPTGSERFLAMQRAWEEAFAALAATEPDA